VSETTQQLESTVGPAAAPFITTPVGRYWRKIAGEHGNKYIARARTFRTLQQYASAVTIFEKWCAAHGRQHMPASVDTIEAYIIDLADEGYTYSTIAAYLQAVCTAHKIAKHRIDRGAFAETLRGIRREASRPQQAAPLLAADLAGILAMLDPAKPRDARDGCLLALGFGAALRQAELTGLDLERRGIGPDRGTGILRVRPKGLEVELVSSKTSQLDSVKIALPARDIPEAKAWLEHWTAAGKREPGAPLFVPIGKGERLLDMRLAPKAVAGIVKARVRALLASRRMKPAEVTRRLQGFTGHSLRAGYATSAARAGIPEWMIRRRMRHRSAEMVARYTRAELGWKESGLAGLMGAT
jgi:integrase